MDYEITNTITPEECLYVGDGGSHELECDPARHHKIHRFPKFLIS